jgi:predicted phage replisome organizer
LADVKWIKITTDIFDDEKILMIESMPSADSIIVIWLKLLTFAGKQNNDGVFLMSNRIAYTDEMLACIFRRDVNLVRLALKTFEQFGMIEIIEKVITIPNWNKHQTLDAYEKKKERDRLYQAERRAKQRLLAAGSSDESSDSQATPSSDVVVSEEDEEKELDIEIDKKNSASQPSKAEVDAFFESIWELYPVKKGKGQVSDTKRKALFKIGYDRMEQAINRYLTELKKDASWRKPQNGSTFFNSGYVDYLDENFVPDQTTPKPVKQSNYHKQSKADELNDAYQMMAAWGEGG